MATPSHSANDSCPSCRSDNETHETDRDDWIRCDACRTWYHWRCAGDGDIAAVDKWFCTACREQDPTRTITLKPPARKSTRSKPVRDYANMHSGEASADAAKWAQMLEQRAFSGDDFPRMEGERITREWLESDPSALSDPIVIEKPSGLGMKMPGDELTIEGIAEMLGGDMPVEVIDVATQSNVPGWTLARWAQYYSLQPSARDKIRNVISLEISGTKLADQVLPPRLVRELDWVEKFWPSTKKGKGHVYPKVQLYCLMGVAGAWTDWHVDFAGSSVYYHILKGSKTFLFIRPTPANLSAYERWSGTEIQSHTWLGDLVDEVVRVDLVQGNTMMIPTGWIHAVYTPSDALVFGGNFLHSYNAATQFRVRDIEIATQVPKKFRFPLFSRLCWYAGEKYLRDLRAREEFPLRVLKSVEALSEFLVSEARAVERGPDAARREAKDQIPSDKVKDASALARELRWRVRLASGYGSEGEEGDSPGGTTASQKRKRGDHESGAWGQRAEPSFRHFAPKVWGRSEESREEDTRRVRISRPATGEDWADSWVESADESKTYDAEDAAEAEVTRARRVVIRVRRTSHGLERQRVERTVEHWQWPAIT
ncbi:Clavaminate synthase-like protein [Auriscalpium vulgare]|uniref:Clavaminate synthase-like protein n=1 Tax=Auriscalpium vulgare TaxID=40419 RepID=A0ACB8RVW9_9AGAM|nr:Clavaminate synthase-like protein [Auriscalpium vulgare]